MKRLLFVLLSAAGAGGGVAMYLKQDLGELNIRFAEYSIQATLLEAGLAILVMLLAYLTLAYAWSLLQTFAALFGRKRQQRLSQKAQHALVQGQIELAEGRFDKAEKLLLQKVDHNEHALIAYLSAARAAQHQGAHDRRDEYLRRAHRENPEADIAIGLTQAELQMAHSQFEQALATLSRLNELAPQHAYVLKLLASTYRKLGDWEHLLELLPDIEKVQSIGSDELLSLKIDTWCGLLSECARLNDVEALMSLWDSVPRPLASLVEMVEHYARELVSLGAYGEAELELREQLERRWEDSTIRAYAELDVLAGEDQVRAAEGWLKEHPSDAMLLLALGKMHISRSIWGKARSYLEASLSFEPMPETYLVLAQLLEDHLDDPGTAGECYRRGLHMLTGDYGEAALAQSKNDFLRELHARPDLKIIR